MKEIRIALEDAEYEQLNKAKKHFAVTWKELLFRGAEKQC